MVYYLAFFALNFAHLARRAAAAILARAAAESLRVPPLDFPVTPLKASIACPTSHVLLSTALLSHLSLPFVFAFLPGEDLTAIGPIMRPA